MNNVTTKRTRRFVLMLLLLTPAFAWTQEPPGVAPRPDPRQLFAEMIQPYRSLNDYTVKIHAKVTMPTIRIPDFTATIYFKQPDRFHVETKSFAPIPRNSGIFNPLQFDPARNRIAFQKRETLGQVQADLYRVEPLDAKSPVRYYQVWVGGLPRRILQVENLTFRGTKGLATLSYRTVAQGADSWLLPEKVRIHLTFPEGAQGPDVSPFTARDNPVSGGMRRLDEVDGEGNIDISYSGWRVNTGLEASLFNSDKTR